LLLCQAPHLRTDDVLQETKDVKEYIRALTHGGGRPSEINGYVVSRLRQPNGKVQTERISTSAFNSGADSLTPGGYEGFNIGAISGCLAVSGSRADPVVRNAAEVGPVENGNRNTLHESKVQFINASQELQQHTETYSKTVIVSSTATVADSFGLDMVLPIPAGAGATISVSKSNSETELKEVTFSKSFVVNIPANSCAIAGI